MQNENSSVVLAKEKMQSVILTKEKMQNENSVVVVMGESEILARVDKILALQTGPGPKRWLAAHHCALVASVAVEYGLPEGMRKDFRLTLERGKGLGSNCSAFGKWLASDKGGKRIPPILTASALASEYDAI